MTRRKDRREAVFLFHPSCFVNYPILVLRDIAKIAVVVAFKGKAGIAVHH
jgi:hypothetical protein